MILLQEKRQSNCTAWSELNSLDASTVTGINYTFFASDLRAHSPGLLHSFITRFRRWDQDGAANAAIVPIQAQPHVINLLLST